MNFLKYMIAIMVVVFVTSVASAQVFLSQNQFDAGSRPMESKDYRLSGTAGQALVGSGSGFQTKVPLMIPLVSRALAGDVDGDGQRAFQDALLVLQFVLGFQTPTSIQAAIADVDGDGQLTIGDAILILRVVQGLETLSKPVMVSVAPTFTEEEQLIGPSRVVRVAFGSGVSGGDLRLSFQNEARVDVIGIPEGALSSVKEETPGVVRVAFVQSGEKLEEIALRVTLPGLDDLESAQLLVAGNLYDAFGTPIDYVQLDWTLAPAAPRVFALLQNVPNPFNPETSIRYELSEAGFVTLDVYDVTGQLVRQLVSEQMQSGRYTVQWDGRNTSGHSVASGVYFYRVDVAGGRFSAVRRMVLLK